MKILTVTKRGQVTFPKDVLQHLGIRPGDKIAQCGERRGESSCGGCWPVEEARNKIRTNRYLTS